MTQRDEILVARIAAFLHGDTSKTQSDLDAEMRIAREIVDGVIVVRSICTDSRVTCNIPVCTPPLCGTDKRCRIVSRQLGYAESILVTYGKQYVWIEYSWTPCRSVS